LRWLPVPTLYTLVELLLRALIFRPNRTTAGLEHCDRSRTFKHSVRRVFSNEHMGQGVSLDVPAVRLNDLHSLTETIESGG